MFGFHLFYRKNKKMEKNSQKLFSLTKNKNLKQNKMSAIIPSEATATERNEVNHNEKIKLKSLVKETLYNSLAQAIFKIVETPFFTLKAFLLLCVFLSSGLC